MAESYYAARSRRDPAWRKRQLREAVERERRRRELDPEKARAIRREGSRRCRARQAERGLTFHQLLARSPRRNAATLRHILREEVALGRIVYRSTSRRFELNGHLPAEVKEALADLRL